MSAIVVSSVSSNLLHYNIIGYNRSCDDDKIFNPPAAMTSFDQDIVVPSFVPPDRFGRLSTWLGVNEWGLIVAAIGTPGKIRPEEAKDNHDFLCFALLGFEERVGATIYAESLLKNGFFSGCTIVIMDDHDGTILVHESPKDIQRIGMDGRFFTITKKGVQQEPHYQFVKENLVLYPHEPLDENLKSLLNRQEMRTDTTRISTVISRDIFGETTFWNKRTGEEYKDHSDLMKSLKNSKSFDLNLKIVK